MSEEKRREDDPIEFIKPDGEVASLGEVIDAMHRVTQAKPGHMDCPVDGCDGRVEAQCHIWFDVSPEGVPWVYGLGWREGGEILCTVGGDHLPKRLKDQLWPTFLQLAAIIEQRLDVAVKEDDLK